MDKCCGLMCGGEFSGGLIKTDGAIDGGVESPAAGSAGDGHKVFDGVFAEGPATIALVAAIGTDLNTNGGHGTPDEAVADFAGDGGFCDAWLELPAGDFDSVHEDFGELSKAMSFEGGECQPKELERASGGASTGKWAVSENFTSAAEVFEKRGVRLKPLALFELEAESECVAFEELGGIDGVGGEHAGVFGEENAGLAAVGGVATEVSAGGDPGEVSRVLEEDGVRGGSSKEFSEAGVFMFNVGEPLGVVDQTARRWRRVALTRRHTLPLGGRKE